MKKQLFKDDVIKSALHDIEPLYKKCIAELKQLKFNVPEQMKVDKWDSKIDGEIWGLRLKLKNSMSPALSGWISTRSNKFLKTSPDTKLGCLVNDSLIRLEQFSLALVRSNELFFVAIGSRAKEVLNIVIEAEQTFDPNNFDEDGYSKFELDDKCKPINGW